jgi:hypothetical protein
MDGIEPEIGLVYQVLQDEYEVMNFKVKKIVAVQMSCMCDGVRLSSVLPLML